MPRTDNDTWDLATSVGATATMVAAARAIASRAPKPLIHDPFAETLVRAVGVDFFSRWVSGDLHVADVDDHESGWKLEHMPDAMAARTQYFDAFLRDATQAGIRQVVILAAGLDARAYRLTWPPDTTVFEIDQPAVIDFKTATLSRLGSAPTADRRAVAVDLRNDWPAALIEAGFDTARPTAWIAEGLLGYLPPEAQDRLLDNITRCSADGSRLATEAVPNLSPARIEEMRDTMRKASAKWRDHGLDLDFADLGYVGERNDVAAYLDRLGWQSVGTPMSELLADNGLSAIPQTNDSVSVADTVYYTSVAAGKGKG